MYGVTVTGCYRKGLVAVWSVEDVQHSVHLAGVICVVVIILSRGAGGGADIIRPVSLSRVVTHSQTQPRYGANITAASEQDL